MLGAPTIMLDAPSNTLSRKFREQKCLKNLKDYGQFIGLKS